MLKGKKTAARAGPGVKLKTTGKLARSEVIKSPTCSVTVGTEAGGYRDGGDRGGGAIWTDSIALVLCDNSTATIGSHEFPRAVCSRCTDPDGPPSPFCEAAKASLAARTLFFQS